ncbi:MAG: di-trans,poly-cis-decaprenylcistransferase [Chloroflexi bacterium]|nr:di-trans,poly-cis-decaprenylcistransferase [Chloroflexota bacterium]MBU1750291.1 di-trans,poly-cis-decaprenylcistransferase [Chloroflexota bacterium]MBU1877870.1 di-trans,poly-cis-decaprenylcistransferase [Chloroflexota bacterium]
MTDVNKGLEIAGAPRHVAIIMDGNGRWAKGRGLPRLAGHRAGVENIRRIIEGCGEYGVEILTLWAFSTENWTRPLDEVRGLMRLLGETLDRQLDELHEKGVRLCHSGRLENLSEDLQHRVRKAVELTKNNDRLTVNLAFDYGGRADILHAVQGIIQDGVPAEQVDDALFSRYLWTAGLPDPDLIVRTSGEYRVSNFMLWQSAYAEYFFTPLYWPDFGKDELRQAILAYVQRERRFGGLA